MPLHKDGNSSCHGQQADQHSKKANINSSRVRGANTPAGAAAARGSSLKELSIKDKLFRLKKVDIHQDNECGNDESHFKVCKNLF